MYPLTSDERAAIHKKIDRCIIMGMISSAAGAGFGFVVLIAASLFASHPKLHWTPIIPACISGISMAISIGLLVHHANLVRELA